MDDPSKPLRLKREGMALYLANGYGPSAAYSSAGYSFKSREHLSKNAGTLASDPEIEARVAWLKAHPQEAIGLLQHWIAQRDKNEAQRRSQALSEAVAKRKAAVAQREKPRLPEGPVHAADQSSVLDLLHHCQDEAKAVYERAKSDHADPYVIKASLSAHRDFTVSLQRYREDAKQVGVEALPVNDSDVFDLYCGMCAALGEQTPLPVEDTAIEFASVEEMEAAHDESELRFNIGATLHQYDLLTHKGNQPDMRVQLQLLDVLAKSTQRLIALQAHRRAQREGRKRVIPVDFQIDPSVVLRWAKEYEIA